MDVDHKTMKRLYPDKVCGARPSAEAMAELGAWKPQPPVCTLPPGMHDEHEGTILDLDGKPIPIKWPAYDPMNNPAVRALAPYQATVKRLWINAEGDLLIK